MKGVFPLVASLLTFSQKTSGQLVGFLETLFANLGKKGPEIFDQISSIYKLIWILYFCLFVPLLAVNLLYAFWAGGFLGGPKSVANEPAKPKQKGFKAKCVAICK